MCWCQCQWANSNGLIGLSTCTILSDGAQTKRSVASAPIQGIKCLSSKRLREKKKNWIPSLMSAFEEAALQHRTMVQCDWTVTSISAICSRYGKAEYFLNVRDSSVHVWLELESQISLDRSLKSFRCLHKSWGKKH